MLSCGPGSPTNDQPDKGRASQALFGRDLIHRDAAAVDLERLQRPAKGPDVIRLHVRREVVLRLPPFEQVDDASVGYVWRKAVGVAAIFLDCLSHNGLGGFEKRISIRGIDLKGSGDNEHGRTVDQRRRAARLARCSYDVQGLPV